MIEVLTLDNNKLMYHNLLAFLLCRPMFHLCSPKIPEDPLKVLLFVKLPARNVVNIQFGEVSDH